MFWMCFWLFKEFRCWVLVLPSGPGLPGRRHLPSQWELYGWKIWRYNKKSQTAELKNKTEFWTGWSYWAKTKMNAVMRLKAKAEYCDCYIRNCRVLIIANILVFLLQLICCDHRAFFLNITQVKDFPCEADTYLFHLKFSDGAPAGRRGWSRIQTWTGCRFSSYTLPPVYIAPGQAAVGLWFHSGFVCAVIKQEQSNKSSTMKKNDNKLNKEKQMSRSERQQGTRWREGGWKKPEE